MQLSVKTLTAIFRSSLEISPTCMTSWPKRLDAQRVIPWDSLGPMIHSPITTTKDVHSWFKCILHRGMAVRRVFPKDGSSFCRMCDCYTERIEHFAECTQLRSTFEPFIKLLENYGIKGPFDNATRLLGCTRSPHDDCAYSALPNGLFTLLIILWKFIVLMLTEVDTSGLKYSADKVWRLTLTRLTERCNAAHFSFQARVRRAAIRELPPPNPSRLTKALAPLAKVDHKGRFHYSDHFLALAKHHLEDKLNLDQDPPLGEDEAPADQSTLEPIKFVKA